MKPRNHGIRVAVSTTMMVREVDEPSTPGTPAGGSKMLALTITTPSMPPTEDRNLTVPVSLTCQKVPKCSRSSLALSYLDSFQSPSKKPINPLPSDADLRIMLKEFNKAVDIFLKLNAQEVAEQITKNLLPLYLSVTVNMFWVLVMITPASPFLF